MDTDDFTPEERKATRRILKEDQAKRRREAQEKAESLTRSLSAHYGNLSRPGG